MGKAARCVAAAPLPCPPPPSAGKICYVFLQRLRRGVGSWFIKGMLFLIALVFALWGVGGFQGRRRRAVAWVDGVPIGLADYRLAVEAALRRYERLYPQGVPERVRELIRQQALESLVQRRILERAAGAIGLSVSKGELVQSIVGDPMFQRNGAFDRELYLWTVSRLGMRPREFERRRAEDLLVNKLLRMIEDSPLPTPGELRSYQELAGLRVSLKFVRLRPEDFLQRARCTEQELREYYRRHREEFRRGLALKACFLRFDPRSYRSQVRVEPQEVEERYQLEGERFQIPERRRLRRILVKERKEAEEILKRLRAGADFASLARARSRGPEARRGGDLGFLSEREVQPSLRQAFRVRAGELVGPIRTPQGFVILKVEEIRPGRTRPLQEVRPKLVEEIRREKARRKARAEAKRAYLALRRGQRLEAWARRRGLSPTVEGPCTRREARGAFRAAFDRLAGLRPGSALRPFEWGGSFWVFQLVERQEPRALSFREARQEVERRLRWRKARRLALQAARTALQEGKPLERIAREHGWRLEHTGPFGWAGPWVPRIGRAPQLKEAAFRLRAERPCLTDPLEVNDQVIMACLESRTVQRDERVKEGLRDRLHRSLRLAWMERLRRRARVRVTEQLP